MARCPVCHADGLGVKVESLQNRQSKVTCRRCGLFSIPDDVGSSLTNDERPRLSHAIRKMQRANAFAPITRELANNLRAVPLPSVLQQFDGLIEFIGDRLRLGNPLGRFELDTVETDEMLAEIGAYDSATLGLLLGDLVDKNFVQWTKGTHFVRLLEPAWRRYEELKSAAADSRSAFMAMPAGDERLKRIFEKCWVPAAKRAGFELKTVGQRVGPLDDYTRVAIRRSRLIVAELTGSNNGAYWAAGFGEGLGKPVIYTCEKSAFTETTRAHFDLNHRPHVIWEEGKLEAAADELTTRIRASIPAAAHMEDSGSNNGD
jgi:hypothetical protein